MHLDYEYERFIINNCKEMTILMNVISIINKIKRMIQALTTITISSYNSIIISIRLRDNV